MRGSVIRSFFDEIDEASAKAKNQIKIVSYATLSCHFRNPIHLNKKRYATGSVKFYYTIDHTKNALLIFIEREGEIGIIQWYQIHL